MARSKGELDEILAKFKGRCTYCGVELNRAEHGQCSESSPPAGSWGVDHWRPRATCESAGEHEHFDNLWPACCECIDEKGDRTGNDYAEWRWENSRPLPRRWVRELGLEDTERAEVE